MVTHTKANRQTEDKAFGNDVHRNICFLLIIFFWCCFEISSQCWAWSDETDWQRIELIRTNLLWVVLGRFSDDLSNNAKFWHSELVSQFYQRCFTEDTQHQPSRLDERFFWSEKKALKTKVTVAVWCSCPLWRHSYLLAFYIQLRRMC